MKHNVYESANFHNGVIVKPFRDYKKKTSQKSCDADHIQQRDSTQSFGFQNSRDRHQNSCVNNVLTKIGTNLHDHLKFRK